MKNIRYDEKKPPFNAHNCDNVNLNLNDINTLQEVFHLVFRTTIIKFSAFVQTSNKSL